MASRRWVDFYASWRCCRKHWSGQATAALAVVAVMFSLISAFYCAWSGSCTSAIRSTSPAALAVTADRRSILSLNGALILVLGILQGGLMALCVQVIQASLG